MQGAQVLSLVGLLRFHMLCSTDKKVYLKKNKRRGKKKERKKEIHWHYSRSRDYHLFCLDLLFISLCFSFSFPLWEQLLHLSLEENRASAQAMFDSGLIWSGWFRKQMHPLGLRTNCWGFFFSWFHQSQIYVSISTEEKSNYWSISVIIISWYELLHSLLVSGSLPRLESEHLKTNSSWAKPVLIIF